MNKDVAKYVVACLTCQKFKVELETRGYANYGEHTNIEMGWHIMDFLTQLPQIVRKPNLVRVIVDKFKNTAHFLPMNLRMSMQKPTQTNINEILILDGVRSSIVLDRGAYFTSRFCHTFQDASGKPYDLAQYIIHRQMVNKKGSSNL